MKAISAIYENSVENDLLCSDFGQWLLEKYDLVDKIYSSSTSQIFMLIEKGTGNCFVLKAMLNRRVISDIDTIQSLIHPDIVKILKVARTERFTYTIKEYIPGNTLEHYVRTSGPLSEEEALRITYKLCYILQFLHSRPIPVIYRDLKPANIILTDNNDLKLIDLDSIRLYKDEASRDTLFIGTEGFAAPEQFGFSQTDVRTDIYTLGTTLFYLLSGQNPVLDKFRLKNIKSIREDISDNVGSIIERATMFDPDDRYQSIEEFLYAVNSAENAKTEEEPKLDKFIKKLVSEEKYKFYTIVVLALTSVGILLSAAQSKSDPMSSSKTNEPNPGSYSGLRIASDEYQDDNSKSVIIEPVSSPGTLTEVGGILYPVNEADINPDLSLDNNGTPVENDNSGIENNAEKPPQNNSASMVKPIKFVLTPNESEPSNEKVLSIVFPQGSTVRQYSYDNKEWYYYQGSLVITENCIVYSRAIFSDGSKTSDSHRVENIVPKLPTFYIQHSLEPEREYVSEEKLFSMKFSQPVGRLEYSFDEKNWIEYDGPMLFSKNVYLFTRAVLPNGDVITGGVEINNIQPKQKVYTIDHKVDPDSNVSSGKKVVTIVYPKDSLVNEYSFDQSTWLLYTEPIVVTKNSDISTRALMPDGQLVQGSIRIDNISS